MNSLHKTIALQMVRGGVVQADAEKLEAVGEEAAGELQTLISGDIGRYAKPGNPVGEERLQHSGSLDVGQQKRLQPSCLPLHAGEQVLVAFSSRKRAN